jgi:hypothetical protein
VKITKSTNTSIQGSVSWLGQEAEFEASLSGKVSVTVQGPEGFAVLDFLRNLEGGTGSVSVEGGGPNLPPPRRRRTKEEMAADEAKAKVVAEAPAPAPTLPGIPASNEPKVELQKEEKVAEAPAAEADPAPAGEADGDDDPSNYIDDPAAAKAQPPTAAPVQAQVAPGTEAYVAPGFESEIPADLWAMTDWQLLMPAFAALVFKRQNIDANTGLDKAIDLVVSEAQRLMPTMPIATGAQPQTFTRTVLVAMLRKHVQALIAKLA